MEKKSHNADDESQNESNSSDLDDLIKETKTSKLNITQNEINKDQQIDEKLI